MHSARLGVMAGTAVALVLTAISAAAQSAPMPGPGLLPPSNVFSTPGSMPKPSTPVAPDEDGVRFRNPTTQTPRTVQPRRAPVAQPAPATAVAEPRSEPAAQPAAASATAEPRREPAAAAPPPPVAAAPAAAAPAPAPRASVPAPRPRAAATSAAAPAAAPAQAPQALAVDAPLNEALRALIAGKFLERVATRKSDRDAIAAFYEKNSNFQPLWIADGGMNERAKAAVAHLRDVEADGLDPADYPVPNFAGGARALAEAELALTATLLRYARHAQNGRVHFTRVSPNIEYRLRFDESDTLGKLAAAGDIAETLDSFHPQQPAYKALKAKLAEFRQQPAESGPAPIATGPVLRYHRDRRSGRETVMSDPRVPHLRARLGLAAEPNTRYNRSLAMAVAQFQKSHGLQPSGQLNRATVDALNGPNREQRLGAVLATMERWRWMPRDLGRTHVTLNIPDYHLRVYHNGSQVWMTRVVVGKPSQATPLLTETMKYITVNPTWNVPQSIIYNELIPLYETSDPQIFDRMGLRVERARNGDIRVFQPPGERNALGRIRFNFPNKFLVYQHDTPERHYFAHSRRAYSHGCLRVQDPAKYAEVLLSYALPRANVTQGAIERMFGGPEQQIDFQVHIPVHLTYETAFVDDGGTLQFREDIYSLDEKLLALLKGSERAVADTAIDLPADPNYQPTPEDAKKLQAVARNSVPNPFALFERLFR